MIYKLFAGPNHYPGGGYNDFVSAHATIEAAREALRGLPSPWTKRKSGDERDECEWAHIVFDDKILERWRARFKAAAWVLDEVES